MNFSPNFNFYLTLGLNKIPNKHLSNTPIAAAISNANMNICMQHKMQKHQLHYQRHASVSEPTYIGTNGSMMMIECDISCAFYFQLVDPEQNSNHIKPLEILVN